MTLYPSKVWEQFAGNIYSIYKCMHLENISHCINNLIKTMENYNFLTLYYNKIMERSLYQHIGSLHILTITYTMTLTVKQVVKEIVVSALFNRACSIITNKDDLTKENTRIKQVLKKNEYQENIISKIINSHSLS